MAAETTVRVWSTEGEPLGSPLGDKGERVPPAGGPGPGGQFVEWNDGLGHYINNSFPANFTEYAQTNSTDDINSFFFYEVSSTSLTMMKRPIFCCNVIGYQ